METKNKTKMNEQKLVVAVMGQDCEKFIDMTLDSVKGADAIVYCDGGSTDGTHQKAIETEPETIFISNKFDKTDPTMNGRQRNLYLNYMKEHYPDWWCLAIDADEVVQDIAKVKEAINRLPEGVYSPHMEHFIGDLGHVDATQEKHYVPNRLFKISAVESYPEVEHPVLQPKKGVQVSATHCTTIWHLAYIPNLWDIKNRYEQHKAKSNIHTPEFLERWYRSHVFGQYPRRQLDPAKIPPIILNKFAINPDSIYFANRGLEVKHFIDATHWKDHFKCKNAIEFGCGRGPRVYAMKAVGLEATGLEISEWALQNSFVNGLVIGDITEGMVLPDRYDLSIVYDVLEHIDYDKLSMAIDCVIKASKKHVLVSVPVIGDPNLENDPTHKIKETKEWWIKQFTDKGCKELPVPEHFLFKDQLMIFEVQE